MQGRTLRRKTPDQLAGEVEIAVRQFGFRNIYFIDLEFTGSPELVRGLCERLLERGIACRWCCQTRVELVDEPLLALMKRAGCRLIHFGVESGCQRILDVAGKQTTLEKQRHSVALAKRLGLETLCFFLLGYPGETEAEMRETISFARQLNPTYVSFHRISPYPDTPLFQQTLARGEPVGWVDRSEPHQQSAEPMVGQRPTGLTHPTSEAHPAGSGNAGCLFPAFAGSDEERRRVDRLVRKAIWSFYVRPGYVASRLWSGSPLSLWRQLRLFAGYFR
jgi:hypothetical protein